MVVHLGFIQFKTDTTLHNAKYIRDFSNILYIKENSKSKIAEFGRHLSTVSCVPDDGSRIPKIPFIAP